MSSTVKLFTLVFVKKNRLVLLGFKTRGLGQGLWNGFGGKIEQNETIQNCAKREVEEECSLIADTLKHIGVIKYEVDNEPEIHIVHIFTCPYYTGTEKPSEEMNPVRWFNFTDIPFTQMWPDAKFWYPLMLKERFFSAHIIYKGRGVIRKLIIKECDSLKSALELINNE